VCADCGPSLGLLLALLGFATLGTNLLGWFLFVAGIAYAAAAVIVTYELRHNFWESQATGLVTHAEAGDRSFWLISAGIAAVFYLSPLEFLYVGGQKLPVEWLDIAGACLGVLGSVLFLWARRSLKTSEAGLLTSQDGQPLAESGAYRIIRHPAYAGGLLVSAGLPLGYGSLGGTLALVFLLVPAIVWRIHIEEQFLSAHFGSQYAEYVLRTKRLIPGLW
jgi:protein-S-isoprenylcysteine O-methyltransferase Ste14